MAQQGLGACSASFFESPDRRVEADHYAGNRGLGIAHLQADIIPAFRQSRWIEAVEQTYQILYAKNVFLHALV
jgi:hypothetical protein